MRKFTKEISALLAAAAVGSAAYSGISASSAGQVPEADGFMSVSDEEIETTNEELPETAGVPMISDEEIEPTTEEYPLVGIPMPTDEEIEPTTEDYPLVGIPMPTDEEIETTTEDDEILPPLSGDVAVADGDINGDGSFGIADAVTLQKFLLGVPGAAADNWWAADLNYDGKLSVFDLLLMKEQLVSQNKAVPLTLFGLTPSKDGVTEFLSRSTAPQGLTEDKIYNVTPQEITDKYGFRIFKDCDSCETYLEYNKSVYQLGLGFGGYGTLSFAVADLNLDGAPELYFTFSCGSGLHWSMIGCFDTATRQITGYDCDLLNNDMVFAVKNGNLGVYAANLVRVSGYPDFVSITAKPGEKLGEIAFDGIRTYFRGNDVTASP